MKLLPIISLIAVLFLSACSQTPTTPPTDDMSPAQKNGEVIEKNDDDMIIPVEEEDDAMVPSEDDSMMENEEMMTNRSFPNKIVMTNVSINPDAKGEGFYGVMEGETRLYASFMVDKTEESYFYEGWLICDGTPYTTGELEFFDGLYENYFASTDFPTVCQKYVLTLEPDDGDPAPAEHIMEGVMEGIAHTEPSMPWDDEKFKLI